MTFLTTPPPLARALAERNYDSPTPVQTAVLADAAADRDLLVSAQTGSGKTVAYGLSIAPNLLGDADRFERSAKPLALIEANFLGQIRTGAASGYATDLLANPEASVLCPTRLPSFSTKVFTAPIARASSDRSCSNGRTSCLQG